MISPGLGSALSGLFTAVGAVVAIFLAQYFFRGRITDLKGAVRETEETLERYQAIVAEKLELISGRIESLNLVIGSVQESVAKTQAAVHDNQSEQEQEQQGQEPHWQQKHTDEPDQATQTLNKEKLSVEWYKVLDHVEGIASSPNVDGRTRARYGRIDRRSYYDLFAALDHDGRMGKVRQIADAAAELWYSCRRRREITENEVSKMREYREEITAVPIP